MVSGSHVTSGDRTSLEALGSVRTLPKNQFNFDKNHPPSLPPEPPAGSSGRLAELDEDWLSGRLGLGTSTHE